MIKKFFRRNYPMVSNNDHNLPAGIHSTRIDLNELANSLGEKIQFDPHKLNYQIEGSTLVVFGEYEDKQEPSEFFDTMIA